MGKNTSKIYKVTLDGNFTQIPNETLQSQELTAEEIYLICNLCSRPEGWVFIKTRYWRQTQLGRDRYNKAWKGLTDKGYIKSVKRMKGNLIEGYDYKISYLPMFGVTESQYARSSDLLKSSKLINKEANNKEYINKEVINKQYIPRAKEASTSIIEGFTFIEKFQKENNRYPNQIELLNYINQ